MPNLPPSLTELLDCFRPCFTAPTSQIFCAPTTGLLAQPGPRTITGMLTCARLAGRWHHRRALRFFSHAPSVADILAALRLVLIAAQYRPAQPAEPTTAEILTVQHAWAAAAA